MQYLVEFGEPDTRGGEHRTVDRRAVDSFHEALRLVVFGSEDQESVMTVSRLGRDHAELFDYYEGWDFDALSVEEEELLNEAGERAL